MLYYFVSLNGTWLFWSSNPQ